METVLPYERHQPIISAGSSQQASESANRFRSTSPDRDAARASDIRGLVRFNFRISPRSCGLFA